MTKLFIFLIAILTIAGGLWYVKFNHQADSMEIATIWVKDQPIKVLTADTFNRRIKGLSGRQSLPDNWGMLFVFNHCGYHSFWMKDMNFPIDIIWLNQEGVVVDIAYNINPETWPKTFSPQKPACYGLEINAGLSDKYGIKLNQKITVSEKFQPDK
jgi:uncharacterized protein